MSQLTLDQASDLGSQLTGIPRAIVRALIVAEGSFGAGDWVNGNIRNNPFDVTAEWADLAGYGGSLTSRTGGSQGNIASFVDTEAATRAWARGINSFSNYAGLRADLAGGAGTNVLATDLARAGYAGPGNVQSWVNNVVALAGDVAGYVGKVVTQPKEQAPKVSIPNPVQGASDAVAAAVNGVSATVGTAIGNATAPLTSGIANVTNFLSFAGNPSVWTSVTLIAVGIFLTLLGLIFFGASLVPRGAASSLKSAASLVA